MLDIRVEKDIKFGQRATSRPFMDLYNIGNSDAASNIAWASGSSFELPSTIIGPRIMRVGLKFDW